MTNIPRSVDEVRGFLLAGDHSLKPHVPELAQTYASACVEANNRLAKCQRLLQQGLRGEAIHLAKEAPDLLDTIQALDFPERSTWLEIVKQFNLTLPPDFDATAIEFLQTAYVEEDPLKDLLRGHRRLALVRAPLRQRIDILRKLAEKDANNLIWTTDLQTFEAARMEQIKSEANEARRRQDVVALGILHDELSAKTWLNPPPKALVRGLVQTYTQLRQQQTQGDLTELVTPLHDAFAELDVDKSRALRDRWLGLDPQTTNPLFRQVEPIFLWLKEIDLQEEEDTNYHESLSNLADALTEKASKPDLTWLLETIQEFRRPVPEDLQARFQERMKEIDRETKKKAMILMAFLVPILAFFAWFAWIFSKK